MYLADVSLPTDTEHWYIACDDAHGYQSDRDSGELFSREYAEAHDLDDLFPVF